MVFLQLFFSGHPSADFRDRLFWRGRKEEAGSCNRRWTGEKGGRRCLYDSEIGGLAGDIWPYFEAGSVIFFVGAICNMWEVLLLPSRLNAASM